MTVRIKGPRDFKRVVPVYAWLGYGVVAPNAVTTNGSARVAAQSVFRIVDELPKLEGWSCEVIPGELAAPNTSSVDELSAQLLTVYRELLRKNNGDC